MIIYQKYLKWSFIKNTPGNYSSITVILIDCEIAREFYLAVVYGTRLAIFFLLSTSQQFAEGIHTSETK